MKVEASNIEEFFENSGKWKDIMMELDQIIMKINPDIDRKFYTMDTMSSIGYAAIPYKPNNTFGGVWPMIGIAPQKNTANLYVMAMIGDQYIPEVYGDKLGKVSMGKSCIRIRRMETVNVPELENLLRDAFKEYDRIMAEKESGK